MAGIKRSKDWKYLLMLVVSIASVAVPIWLAKYQNPDKRVIIRVLSQASLHPTDKGTFPGLQVLVDGVALSDPYLSVLQVVNEGEIPVSATEFEAPLELHVDSGRRVVRARVTETNPKDVIANISTEDQILQLKPTLLNSKDSITVAILSTGGAPTFSSRARIKGIPTVPVLGREKKNLNPFVIAFLAVNAFLFAVAAMAANWRWTPFSKQGTYVLLRTRTILAISLVLQSGAVGLATILMNIFEVEVSSWVFWVGITSLFVIAIPFARWLERHPPSDDDEQVMRGQCRV